MDSNAVLQTRETYAPDAYGRFDRLGLEGRVPPALHDVVRRHHEHLIALVASLRTAGISEAVVEQSIDVLIERYKIELTNTVAQLAKGSTDA